MRKEIDRHLLIGELEDRPVNQGSIHDILLELKRQNDELRYKNELVEQQNSNINYTNTILMAKIVQSLDIGDDNTQTSFFGKIVSLVIFLVFIAWLVFGAFGFGWNPLISFSIAYDKYFHVIQNNVENFVDKNKDLINNNQQGGKDEIPKGVTVCVGDKGCTGEDIKK